MLTETGFYRPTFDELLEAQEARAKKLFGDDIDTSNLSVLGKYIRINVNDLDMLWQTLESVYYARFPNTASGVSLERLCVFAGISRNPATFAKHKIIIHGTKGATIESGFLVSTQSQEQCFYTLDDYTIPDDETEGDIGMVEAMVYAENAGTQGNVLVGNINDIVNPSADVTEIEHIALVEYGKDIESDYDLRIRFSEAIAGSGATTLESIKAAVLRVENVQDVYIRENDSDEVDETGIAPHSFECFVLAPEEQGQLIAEAILNKKPAGIKPTGDVSFNVADSTGIMHQINFTWTEQKNVYVKAEILTNGLFPVDGITQIKTNLVDLLSNLSNGETVYISTLYGEIHIEGVESVINLQVSTDGKTWVTGNVACDLNQVARTSADLIEVIIK